MDVQYMDVQHTWRYNKTETPCAKIDQISTSPFQLQRKSWKWFDKIKGLKGLKINKLPAIKPVTEGFFEKWNTILSDSGNGLVQLLLSESLQVVKKPDKELDSEIKKIHPNAVREKWIQFENKYENYKKKLEFHRIC